MIAIVTDYTNADLTILKVGLAKGVRVSSKSVHEWCEPVKSENEVKCLLYCVKRVETARLSNEDYLIMQSIFRLVRVTNLCLT